MSQDGIRMTIKSNYILLIVNSIDLLSDQDGLFIYQLLINNNQALDFNPVT